MGETIKERTIAFVKSKGITMKKFEQACGLSSGYVTSMFLDVDLTLYLARHTWATIANEIGIPKETIARALGHSTSTVKDVYINYNNRSVDEANRKVIDFINNL